MVHKAPDDFFITTNPKNNLNLPEVIVNRQLFSMLSFHFIVVIYSRQIIIIIDYSSFSPKTTLKLHQDYV